MNHHNEIEKAMVQLNACNFKLCSIQCGVILEDILKNTYNNKKDAFRRSYSYNGKLTLGSLLIIYKKNDGFSLLSDFYKIDKKKLDAIDFDTMVSIRNKASHDGQDDKDTETEADAHIIFGYLLKLLTIISPFQKITPKDPVKSLPVPEPQPPKPDPRLKKIIYIPGAGKPDPKEPLPPKDTVEVCRNNETGKYFIYLGETTDKKSRYITPEGNIKELASNLFHQIEEQDKEFILTKKLITREQHEKLIFYKKALSNDVTNIIPHPQEQEEPGYIKKYRKMIENPDSIPSIMLKLIKEAGKIPWKDLKKSLIQKYNYKDSGSLGASIRVLEIDGHIKISGRGDDRSISYSK
ncbi:MAG: hypothetical protein EHM85_03430 [Desulfobacteraceae bacterium]|nr:MAG: hypothetical protein EHM85_03430 [Desulfobacteraceae bacterium]